MVHSVASDSSGVVIPRRSSSTGCLGRTQGRRRSLRTSASWSPAPWTATTSACLPTAKRVGAAEGGAVGCKIPDTTGCWMYQLTRCALVVQGLHEPSSRF